MLLYLTCCGETVALEQTYNEVFGQLNKTLPTVSPKDTAQTQREVAIHRELFLGLCPKEVCEAL